MNITPTAITDVLTIDPTIHGDHRGFFLESWNAQTFKDHGLDLPFVQDNHSRSKRRILRGLHYQIRHPQGKLVRVITGSIFDVAVDLRRSSPTFGQWVGEILSEENHRMLWIPPGFAHGFYVLSNQVDFLYKCTDRYDPDSERCIHWNDPELNINWPTGNLDPIVSAKDAQGTSFAEAETFA